MSLIDKLPTKPNIDDYNLENDTQAAKYQEKLSDYNRMLTLITQMQSEEAATQSNMDKARHDAVMSIISNMK